VTLCLSTAYISSIGASTGLHPDFGANWNGGPFGIPYTTVPGTQPLVPVAFDYADESDPGPYPIPPDAPVEGGSDRHVLVVDRDHCKLYEMWNASKQPDGSWQAGSGAVFDLRSNALRPDTWTSAGAAGLPILPGLVRYDEVAAGEIKHAIRFTVQHTRKAHLWPARHDASSSTDANLPPMGQRFRLKASKDLSGFPAQIQVIFTAFKRYGLVLADNGSNWYVSGAPDARWDDDVLVTAFSTAALPAQATLVLTDTHTGSALLPGVWYAVPVTATTGVYTQVTSVGLLVGGSRVYLPVVP
jgi:hypothetical protein